MLRNKYLVLQNAWMKIFQHILIWVEEQTYWISSRFLVLGFELELYSPSDYCMVYWYLSVVLIKLVEKIHLRALMNNETGEFANLAADIYHNLSKLMQRNILGTKLQ